MKTHPQPDSQLTGKMNPTAWTGVHIQTPVRFKQKKPISFISVLEQTMIFP